jgi:hypothetical protein
MATKGELYLASDLQKSNIKLGLSENNNFI